MLSHFDYLAFQSINHLAITDKFLNPLMVLMAEKAEYVFFIGILLYWFFQKSQNRRMVVEACLAACIALAINVLIGMVFYRDRPFVAHHVNWLIPHAKNASFPSDHATAAFVIATAIWIWRKRDGWIWLVLAGMISVSRVWTGVHYPSDVIAGMLIGVGTAFLAHFYSKKLKVVERVVFWIINFYEKIEKSLFKRNNVQR
jgi:undecaprenyl-diphosphatase